MRFIDVVGATLRGQLVPTLPAKSFSSVSLNRRGSYLVATCHDGTARLHDLLRVRGAGAVHIELRKTSGQGLARLGECSWKLPGSCRESGEQVDDHPGCGLWCRAIEHNVGTFEQAVNEKSCTAYVL